MPDALRCPQEIEHDRHVWLSVRDASRHLCNGLTARQVAEAAPRPSRDGDAGNRPLGIGPTLRELGIGIRHARFVPDRGPAVRIDVGTESRWLTPRELRTVILALQSAERKATSS